MNVKGREPEGIVDPKDYERVRNELIAGIEAIVDDRGRPIGSKAYRPEDIYRSVNGVAPDLIVYFGDLDWRSVGAVGMDSIYTFENDTGPDDANHAEDGIFILADPRSAARGRRDGHRIMDLAPTLLALLGVPIPAGAGGRAMA